MLPGGPYPWAEVPVPWEGGALPWARGPLSLRGLEPGLAARGSTREAPWLAPSNPGGGVRLPSDLVGP